MQRPFGQRERRRMKTENMSRWPPVSNHTNPVFLEFHTTMGGLPRRLSSSPGPNHVLMAIQRPARLHEIVRVPVLERKRNSVQCAITDATMTCTNRLTDGEEWLHGCAFVRHAGSPQITWSKCSVRTWSKE